MNFNRTSLVVGTARVSSGSVLKDIYEYISVSSVAFPLIIYTIALVLIPTILVLCVLTLGKLDELKEDLGAERRSIPRSSNLREMSLLRLLSNHHYPIHPISKNHRTLSSIDSSQFTIVNLVSLFQSLINGNEEEGSVLMTTFGTWFRFAKLLFVICRPITISLVALFLTALVTTKPAEEEEVDDAANENIERWIMDGISKFTDSTPTPRINYYHQHHQVGRF